MERCGCIMPGVDKPYYTVDPSVPICDPDRNRCAKEVFLDWTNSHRNKSLCPTACDGMYFTVQIRVRSIQTQCKNTYLREFTES